MDPEAVKEKRGIDLEWNQCMKPKCTCEILCLEDLLDLRSSQAGLTEYFSCQTKRDYHCSMLFFFSCLNTQKKKENVFII